MFRRSATTCRTQKRMESSLGSAVIMSAKATLLTNNHVTAGADQIIVALRDGRENHRPVGRQRPGNRPGRAEDRP